MFREIQGKGQMGLGRVKRPCFHAGLSGTSLTHDVCVCVTCSLFASLLLLCSVHVSLLQSSSLRSPSPTPAHAEFIPCNDSLSQMKKQKEAREKIGSAPTPAFGDNI